MVRSNFIFIFIAILYLLSLSSCNSDEANLRAVFKNKEFTVSITSPDDGQGFSIKETLGFKAVVRFTKNNADASILSHLETTFYSDKDGLLNGELINKDGNITFKPKTLSAGEHIITLKAVDPNHVEKLSSIHINTLAPGTIKLTVRKDSRENAIVNWSIPSPELVDVIELYRTQYTFSSGGNSYSQEPWDTIRYQKNSQSFYDNQLPFADSVTYSIRAYTKDGYWSKNEVDTTIAGTKRFKLQVTGDLDWNAYGSDAISMGPEKIIHIRNGGIVTAFDFENMSVIKSLDVKFPITYFHVGDYGSGPELYIAQNQTLKIYDASTYEKKTEIDVNYKIEGIQGHNNLLFLSMVNYVNRTSLFKTSNLAGGYRFSLLDDGASLIAISYSITPTDMKFVNFKKNLNNPEIISDKYHGTYPLNAGLVKIIPMQNHVITSWFGSVYTADENMDFIGSLNDVESEYFTCFAFNDSGTIIYAGLRDEKKISIYSFPKMSKLGEIKTKGHPAFLFFKGSYLVSVSSTRGFNWPDGPSEIGFEIFDL